MSDFEDEKQDCGSEKLDIQSRLFHHLKPVNILGSVDIDNQINYEIKFEEIENTQFLQSRLVWQIWPDLIWRYYTTLDYRTNATSLSTSNCSDAQADDASALTTKETRYVEERDINERAGEDSDDPTMDFHINNLRLDRAKQQRRSSSLGINFDGGYDGDSDN